MKKWETATIKYQVIAARTLRVSKVVLVYWIIIICYYGMSKAPSVRLKWKTDLEKSVVILNFERRGWQRVIDRDRFFKWLKKDEIYLFKFRYYFLDQKEKETLRAKIANGIFIGPQVTEMNITLSGSIP